VINDIKTAALNNLQDPFDKNQPILKIAANAGNCKSYF
tara:strand:+ start:40 stop:153 length:114 start_codon:yes stop_codon:yes gene_type:complete